MLIYVTWSFRNHVLNKHFLLLPMLKIVGLLKILVGNHNTLFFTGVFDEQNIEKSNIYWNINHF